MARQNQRGRWPEGRTNKQRVGHEKGFLLF